MIEMTFAPKIEELSRIMDEFPFEDKDAACKWLSQQFYIIEHATRFEAIGAARLPLELRKEFRHRVEHLIGEFDHDELIIRDVREMGFKGLEPMHPCTKALVSFIYYELSHLGSDSLFGISLLLEGLATKQCAKVWKRLYKAHGIKSDYLKIHDEADKKHFPETLELVEGYSLERKKVIIDSLQVCFFLYKTIVESCLVGSGSRKMVLPRAA